MKEGTPQGAAAWVKRMKETSNGFEYQSVDTGKPQGDKRKSPKGDGYYQPTRKDVYVRFNPELADQPDDPDSTTTDDVDAEDPADSIA